MTHPPTAPANLVHSTVGEGVVPPQSPPEDLQPGGVEVGSFDRKWFALPSSSPKRSNLQDLQRASTVSQFGLFALAILGCPHLHRKDSAMRSGEMGGYILPFNLSNLLTSNEKRNT
jgi:hypothetical protein